MQNPLCCVASGKSLHLSKLLEDRENNHYHPGGPNETTMYSTAGSPGHRKHSLSTYCVHRTGSGIQKGNTQFCGPGALGLPRLRCDAAETWAEEVWELRGGAQACRGVSRHPKEVTTEKEVAK